MIVYINCTYRAPEYKNKLFHLFFICLSSAMGYFNSPQAHTLLKLPSLHLFVYPNIKPTQMKQCNKILP